MRKLIGRPSQRIGSPTAFVLNISFAGLGAVRSLGRAGVPVVGLDPDPAHVGFASRYLTTAAQCPHPVHEPERLVDFLLEQGKRLERPGVLSPASDAFVLFLSRYRDALGEHFLLILPPAEVLEAAVDKRKLYDLAARVGVGYAATHYPKTMADVQRIKDELDYPVYLKPYYSHLWQVAFPGRGKGIKAHTPAELVASFEEILPTGVEVMVQSIIAGHARNVRTVYAYIAQSGEPLGVVTTRKIRQFPIEFGRGSLAETFHDPEFAELGLGFLRDIGYRGFGTVEFKRDDRDGQLKITDLNPRWVKPIRLPIVSGVDFPLIHYLDLIGETPEPATSFRAGVRWLDLVNDLHSGGRAVREGELSLPAWARSWLRVRAYPSFALDDPHPFFKEYGYGTRLLRAPVGKLLPGR